MRDTQKRALPHIRALHVEERTEALILDAATRRNLELDASLSGNEEATLLAVIDSCITAMGSRQLRRWLNRPLTLHAPLRARYHGPRHRSSTSAASTRCARRSAASATSSASSPAWRCARRGRGT